MSSHDCARKIRTGLAFGGNPERFGQRLAASNKRSTRMANTQSARSHGDQCALLQFRAMTVKHG